MSICRKRVAAIEAQKRELDEQNKAALSRITQTVDKYNDLKSKYDNATEFIRDPFGYLKSSVEQKVYDRLFPRTDSEARRIRGAEDIFNQALWIARTGNRHVNKYGSPIVGAIQQEALSHLEERLAHSLAILDQLAVDFRNFGVEAIPSVRPPTSTIPSYAADCAVLRDAAQSRALLERDPGTWMNLNTRCTSN